MSPPIVYYGNVKMYHSVSTDNSTIVIMTIRARVPLLILFSLELISGPTPLGLVRP